MYYVAVAADAVLLVILVPPKFLERQRIPSPVCCVEKMPRVRATTVQLPYCCSECIFGTNAGNLPDRAHVFGARSCSFGNAHPIRYKLHVLGPVVASPSDKEAYGQRLLSTFSPVKTRERQATKAASLQPKERCCFGGVSPGFSFHGSTGTFSALSDGPSRGYLGPLTLHVAVSDPSRQCFTHSP